MYKKNNKISFVKKIFIKKEKKTDLFLEMDASHEEWENPLKFQQVFNDSSLKHMPVKGVNKEVRY